MSCSLTYKAWKRRNATYLKNVDGKTAVVAFSGGKDSSVALDLMKRAAEEYGFEIEAHGGIFPLHVLTVEEQERIGDFWRNRGVPIVWHQVPVSDSEMDQALSAGDDPCRICNQAKKSALLRDFGLQGYRFDRIVAVMGYSLWDIVSAVTEHLLAARFSPGGNGSADQGGKLKARYMETFQRFYPWMVFSSGLTVYKPLIFYNDQEIKRYVTEGGLPITETPCRFKDCRPKRILAQYYGGLQLTFDYDKVLAFARNTLNLPEAAKFENGDEQDYLKNML